MLRGHEQHVYPSVVLRVPHQLVVHPLLLHPHVGGHYLILEVDVHQLGELQPQLDRQLVGQVGDGPDQAVVVAQEVVVQTLGVRIGTN